MIYYNNIAITGATGSWGQELLKQLLELRPIEQPKLIKLFSRNEYNQVQLRRKFEKIAKEKGIVLEFILGDIRDYDSCLRLLEDIDLVFHCAAMKHIDLCEKQPDEALKVNIIGTQNLINSSIFNHVKKFVDVSTDKACQPINLYGLTKAIGETLVINANERKSETKFVCVRGGNVIGSNGSAIPFFRDQIKNENRITLTNPSMTRFFISLKSAIELLIEAAYDENINNGEILVLKMPSISLTNLSKVLISEYGNKNTKVEKIPERPNEKIHEMLVSEFESKKTIEYKNKFYCIKRSEYLIDRKENKMNMKSFSSNDAVLNIVDSYKLLLETGYCKPKKIAILGSKGMLGHILTQYLKEQNCYEIVEINKDNFNIKSFMDIRELIKFLKENDLNFIINCMGILVKQSEENLELAKLINTILPKQLEKEFIDTNTKIIHISTDCVFNGKTNNLHSWYGESSITDGEGVYAKTKIEGEIINEKDLTIRTSIIGPELKENGTGLFHWFLSNKDEMVSGYSNHFWNGETTLQLAKIIELLLFEHITGLQHIYTPNSKFSKDSILKTIKDVFRNNTQIKKVNTGEIINKCLVNDYEQLPVLDEIKSFDKQMEELKNWMINHKSQYFQYEEVL